MIRFQFRFDSRSMQENTLCLAVRLACWLAALLTTRLTAWLLGMRWHHSWDHCSLVAWQLWQVPP